MNKLLEATPPKPLYGKLVEILEKVGTVDKTGWNDHQKYHYMTESDLSNALRQELAKRRIFIFTSVETVERDKETNITTVITNHTFWDAEDGEHFTVQSAGQGYDKQDKGLYKAVTGSMKYFLMKNFLISSGDDPENDGVAKPTAAKSDGVVNNPSSVLSRVKGATGASTPKDAPKVEITGSEGTVGALPNPHTLTTKAPTSPMSTLLAQDAAVNSVVAPVAAKPTSSFAKRFNVNK
jgi:hypothetical protein